MSRVALVLFVVSGAVVLAACGDSASDPPKTPISLGDAGYIEVSELDASKPLVDGGYLGSNGEVIRADRFITDIVSFVPGGCAGYGASSMPDIVLGPPVGAGDSSGGLDVVSLGVGGELVVSFGSNAIVDGPGADFIVFENAFLAGTIPYADLAEVSVSEDGATWTAFPCTASDAPPYGSCAGWHPVHSAPGNGISPIDPTTSGGDVYDLSEIGVAKARFVRVRDKSAASCEGQPRPTNLGFDLDAIAIVHAETP